MSGTPWTAEELALLRDTYSTHTIAQQAALLNRSRCSVVAKRQRLGLDPHTRAYHPRLRRTELLEAEDMIAGGMSTIVAARRIGRSAEGLKSALQRRGKSIPQIRGRQLGQQWSLAAFAHLVGVEESTTWLWWRDGILRSSARARRQQVRFITEQEARRFFADRTTWPRWEPQQIADPAWRDFAQELRDTADGRWLDAAQIAARLGYAAGTVRDWLRDGRLPVGLRIGRAMYVWSTALDGFTPPKVGGRREVRR